VSKLKLHLSYMMRAQLHNQSM